MINIEPIKLLKRSHPNTGETGQGCFMNVIAYLNGESQITDDSPCVCPTIRPIAIFLNDFANDEQRQRLLPYVLRAMGTRANDVDVVQNRLTAIVEYAEFSARLAAKYAAESATESAESAEYAAESAAKYAAESAEYAGYAAAMREAIFQAGLDYLEKVCNPPQEVNQEIIVRANKLLALA